MLVLVLVVWVRVVGADALVCVMLPAAGASALGVAVLYY